MPVRCISAEEFYEIPAKTDAERLGEALAWKPRESWPSGMATLHQPDNTRLNAMYRMMMDAAA